MISIRQGNNIDVMRRMLIDETLRERVQFVYMDPPFNTGNKQSGPAGEFDDPKTQVWDFANELFWCVIVAWKLLSESGSLAIHCDWRTSHAVRSTLDERLGAEHFASEIVWRYRRWPTKTCNFQRVHDTILRYVKCPGKQVWNQLYEPLAESTRKTFGTGKQSARFDANGVRFRSDATSEPSPGVPMGDVWDIPIVAPSGHERTGYPTQKPEALLDRLILASTNERDLIIDPYMGSGTTLASAKRLGRSAIGIDMNPESVLVAKMRLEIE